MNCKVFDITYQRLSKSQNIYEVLGLKIYNKLILELEELPTNIYKGKLHNSFVHNPF